MKKPPKGTDKTKATGGNQVALEKVNTSTINNTSTAYKWQRVLEAFITGKSYNRFESERLLHDHCLHSTVSSLERKGVTIFREFETVLGWRSNPTRVCRYWLDRSEANLRKAKNLLLQEFYHELK